MPVVGTPVAISPVIASEIPGILAPAEQVFAARIPALYGKQILARKRSISLNAGSNGVLIWNMLDADGVPVDLRPLGFTDEDSTSESSLSYEPHARFRIRDNLAVGNNDIIAIPELSAYVDDPRTGRIRIPIGGTSSIQPGVYWSECGIFDGDDNLLFSNVFYTVIERGLWGVNAPGGPPTIAEIRLHLRDSGSQEGLLLGDLRFSDAELAAAICLPIDEWNSTPPPLTRIENIQSFRHRTFWLHAICGYLFLTAAEFYRANHLPYQAAGLAVDDLNKAEDYDRAAQARLTLWRDFIHKRKASDNLDQCWGSLSSPYILPH